MSVVFSIPNGASYPQIPVAPADSLVRAQNAAQNAYQRFLTERSGGMKVGQVLLSDVPQPMEIPVAVPVQQNSGVPIAMAWSLPPGANYPMAQAVSGAAAAIPAVATVVPAVGGAMSPAPGSAILRQGSSVALNGFQSPVMPNQQAFAVSSRGALSPAPPPNLTESLPDPTSVDRQKLQHARTLLDRLQADTAILTQQNQVRKQMLAQYGAQQKAQHAAKVDSELQRDAMIVEQNGNAELLRLQQAMVAQTMQLEQQAAGLTLRYQCQLAEEERLQQDYRIQREFYETEVNIANQMQKIIRGEFDNRGRIDQARGVNSFDVYLGNPGGVPRPVERGSP